MPQPRMTPKLIGDGSPLHGTQKVTVEAVEAFTGNAYVIGGQAIPGEDVQAEVGDFVYVLWAKGNRQRVIDVQARRGNTQTVQVAGGSVVEELFIATDAMTSVTDIYFRNNNQVTALKLSSIAVNGFSQPRQLAWGLGTDRFIVFDDFTTPFRAVQVCKLNRAPKKPYPPGKKATAMIESTITPDVVIPALDTTLILTQLFLDDLGHLLACAYAPAGLSFATPINVYDLTAGGAQIGMMTNLTTPPTIADPLGFLNSFLPSGWTAFQFGGSGPFYGSTHAAFLTSTLKGQVLQWVDVVSSTISTTLFVNTNPPGGSSTTAVPIFAGVAIGGTGQVVLAQNTTNAATPNPVNPNNQLIFYDNNMADDTIPSFIACSPHHALYVRKSNPTPPTTPTYKAIVRTLSGGAEYIIPASQLDSQGPVFGPLALLYLPGLYYTNFVTPPFPATEKDFLTAFNPATDPSVVTPAKRHTLNASTLLKLPAVLLATYPGWNGFVIIPGDNAQASAFQLITSSP